MADATSVDRARPLYKRPLLWIASGALALVVILAAMSMGSKPAAIPYSDFLDQLDAGNVTIVTLFGTQIEGHFKQPVTATDGTQAAPQSVFRSLVPSFGDPALVSQLREHHVSIDVSTLQWLGFGGATVLGIIAAFLLAKPMLLLVGAAFVAGLFRVARGGKMDIRSVLSMIPMFKALPNHSGQSAADLPQASEKSVPPPDKALSVGEHHCTRAWYLRPPLWLLGIALLGLAVFGSMQLVNRPPAIAYSDFLDQLDAGNVARVTFYGTQIDGNFKHAIAPALANASARQTGFRSRVPDFGDEALLGELHKDHVATDVASSSGWSSWLRQLPWPMVVIVVGLLVAGLLRLGRGREKSSAPGASTHPMMAVIGGLFGKKSRDALPNDRGADTAPIN